MGVWREERNWEGEEMRKRIKRVKAMWKSKVRLLKKDKTETGSMKGVFGRKEKVMIR
jgi:hypothetical protein